MSYGVGHRHSSDLALLWMWHRPAATAPNPPLAWKPPYAKGVALKKDKKKKKKKKSTGTWVPPRINWTKISGLFFFSFFLGPHLWHMELSRLGAIAAGPRHSHSNGWSEPHLWPTPQLTAMPDPWPTEWGQGSNLCLHGYWLGLLPLSHNGNSKNSFFKAKTSNACWNEFRPIEK